jgi:hypothetical protein
MTPVLRQNVALQERRVKLNQRNVAPHRGIYQGGSTGGDETWHLTVVFLEWLNCGRRNVAPRPAGSAAGRTPGVLVLVRVRVRMWRDAVPPA